MPRLAAPPLGLTDVCTELGGAPSGVLAGPTLPGQLQLRYLLQSGQADSCLGSLPLSDRQLEQSISGCLLAVSQDLIIKDINDGNTRIQKPYHRLVGLKADSMSPSIRADGLVLLNTATTNVFGSARADTGVTEGRWAFEVTLHTAWLQQLGWATASCPFTDEMGCGDAPNSYAYDGARVRRWSVSCQQYGQRWAEGDIITCCLDLVAGEVWFARNGEHLGVAFSNVQRGAPYFPTVSLAAGEQCALNFGASPLRHAPPGFHPLQAPGPTPAARPYAAYLLSVLQRCCTLSVGPPPAAATSADVAVAAAAVAAGGVTGERVVSCVAAAVGKELSRLLAHEYIITGALLPALLELHGAAPPHAPEALSAFVHLLSSLLPAGGGSAALVAVFAAAANACRSACFEAEALPYSGPYRYLALATALAALPVVQSAVGGRQQLRAALEGLMTVKQLTTLDLRQLLPCVALQQLPDCTVAGEAFCRRRYAASCSQLWRNVAAIEALHVRLYTVLQLWPADDGCSVFFGFVEALIAKNWGARREVRLPGLSATSVLVSLFWLLVRVLAGAARRDASNGGGTVFSAAAAFCTDGPHGAPRYPGLPRLSGQERSPDTVAAARRQAYDATSAFAPSWRWHCHADDAASAPALRLHLADVLPLLEGDRASDSGGSAAGGWGRGGEDVAAAACAGHPAGSGHTSLAGYLLDRLLLLHHLTLAPLLKGASEQVSDQRGLLAMMADVQRQLATSSTPPPPSAAAAAATAARGPAVGAAGRGDGGRGGGGGGAGGGDGARGGEFRCQLLDMHASLVKRLAASVRATTWSGLWVGSEGKVDALFGLAAATSRLLHSVAADEALLCEVPEFYVEAAASMLAHAARFHPRGAPVERYAAAGLHDCIRLLLAHCADRRLANPGTRDALRLAAALQLQRPEYLRVWEDSADAQSLLMPALLSCFQEHGVSTTSILLRLVQGTGLAQLPGSSETASPVFQAALAAAPSSNPALFSAFLDKLFALLNMTATELCVVVKAAHSNSRRSVQSAMHRKVAIMFELTASLSRLLEFLTAAVPNTFLEDSASGRLALQRLAEVSAFLLRHVTTGPSAHSFDHILDLEYEPLEGVSRQELLAPLVGCLANLLSHAHFLDQQAGASPAPYLDRQHGSPAISPDWRAASSDPCIRAAPASPDWMGDGGASGSVMGGLALWQPSSPASPAPRLSFRDLGLSERPPLPWLLERDDTKDEGKEAGAGVHARVVELLASDSLDLPLEALEFVSRLAWEVPEAQSSPAPPAPPVAEATARIRGAVDGVLQLVQDIQAERAAGHAAACRARLRAGGGDADGDAVPEDFIDPLLLHVMVDPVRLPDSRIVVDRSTVMRHLTVSATDPFTRTPLTADMLVPDDALRTAIQAWRMRESEARRK